MRITKSFTKENYDKTKKILIYGAGNYGQIALFGLKSMGIMPDFFVDKNHAEEMYYGVKVIAPEEVTKYKNDIFLIASLNYFFDIMEILNEKNVENYFDIERLIEICPDYSLNEYALDEKNNIEKYRGVINNYNLGKVIIGHVEVVLTEKCTLRCKDCANLMQYYSKPENLDLNEIIRTFDNFLETIDLLLELRLLGGEPFLITDIDKIVDYYSNNEKVKRITIYTNSTIIPKQNVINSLKNEKVVIHMSDYEFSNKVKELDSLFKENKINHYVHAYEQWNDLGSLSKREYSDDVLKKLYEECLMSKCYTFYRGKLFLCPRSAHGERLGCFKNTKKEYIDFNEMTDKIESKRENVIELISNTRVLTACNYCNGSCVRSNKVSAAIQLKR